jgi:hypothetical protein
MRYLTVEPEATRADLTEAITHLRAKQRRAYIPSTAVEIGQEIDELLDRLGETV